MTTNITPTVEISIMPSVAQVRLALGPANNGIMLDAWQFDEATYQSGYRYELIGGVLIVNPAPLIEERDPNDELGYLLRLYQRSHPKGKSLDATAAEQDVILGSNRRRVDRAIWCGLGRLPTRVEVPTICIEFVSAGRRSQERDYREKRSAYKLAGVSEYWIIDRFSRQMTVLQFEHESEQQVVVAESDRYATPRLPGFELPLGELLRFADRWEAS